MGYVRAPFIIFFIIIGFVSSEWLIQDRSVDSDDQHNSSSPVFQKYVKLEAQSQAASKIAAKQALKKDLAVETSAKTTTSTKASTAPSTTPPRPAETTVDGNDKERNDVALDQEPAIEDILKNNWRLLRALAGRNGEYSELDVLLAENWMLLNLLEKKRSRQVVTTAQSAADQSDKAETNDHDHETRQFSGHNETMSAAAAQNSTMAASAVLETTIPTTTAHQAVNMTDISVKRMAKGNFDEPSDNDDFSAEAEEEAQQEDEVEDMIRQNWMRLSSRAAFPLMKTTAAPSTSQASTSASTSASTKKAVEAAKTPKQGAFLEENESEDEEEVATTKRPLLWWRRTQLKAKN